MTQADYETILVEKRDRVGLITLNRPKALNALNEKLSEEILAAVTAFEADDSVGAMVICGSEKAFAAGADIKEMQEKSFVDMYGGDYFGAWDKVARARKPIIAAVRGFALGGGCELAMLCDFIICGEGAKFGQPEIKLGILPGIGGSQRLTALVGKSLAMDLILTGRMIEAAEAKQAGLVARVVADDAVLDTAIEAATIIAGYNLPSVMMAKEAVNTALELSLTDGIRLERRLFQAAFATEGQKEGMDAFLNKRTAAFNGR
ncbi:enoyl-CoA hydratase [Roseixanthobacter pseudopolyaromaticivorans]|uniref:enoyl-CoA hydratase n=1 Tax=Xanthobacteraceae TaxID=335928 RepID=UPI00372957B4